MVISYLMLRGGGLEIKVFSRIWHVVYPNGRNIVMSSSTVTETDVR